MKFYYIALLLLLGVVYSNKVQAQTVRPYSYYSMLNWDTSPYKSYRYSRKDASWDWINFRLLFPNGYDSTAQNGNEYPLIIVLHGGGESGRMEWNNTKKTNTPYPVDDPRRDNNDHHLLYGGREHLTAVESGRFPGFVLFPQNSYGTWVKENNDGISSFHQDLEKAIELVEYLVGHLKVDPGRIYIHGLSAGGLGTWLAAYQRPDLFAAALPMSAASDPAMAEQLAQVPLWVFQGELDTNPRSWVSRQTVEAVKEAGGEVRYTEYVGVGHNTWNKAYQEKDFFEWMLAHSKGAVGTPNQAPVVEAGENKSITLPVTTATLTASASDPDGTIETYLWEKLSGPDVTMEGVATATLSLSKLVEGSYTFRISVVDNDGALTTDEVSLVVNPAANKEPVVNAGEDKTITLPTNTASFTASASDADGSIESYFWEKLSGPELIMEGAKTATLSLSKLVEGTYEFKVAVKDNSGAVVSDKVRLIVKPAPNQKPVVNAGTNKTITLPTNTAAFTAEASDPDGVIDAYLWEKVSGPTASLTGTTTPTLNLKDLVEGSYIFKVTVTDNAGATATDEVELLVNPRPNEAPTVNAGTDKTITLPENKTSLKASASDPDGTISSFLWKKTSGPTVDLTGETTATLSLSNLKEGTYEFSVTVTDNDGKSASDAVKVVVKPAPNQAPTVSAGSDKSITLPTNSITFTAEASDADGKVETYKWEKVSGPSTELSGANTQTLSVSGLQEGAYTFKVTVTDNSGASTSDEVGLLVNPAANKEPVVDAGPDKAITLPESTINLTATASDPDGEIKEYLWKQESGPEIAMAGQQTKTLSLSKLVAGTYIFSITVTDNAGGKAKDEVKLVVNPAPNKAPTVNAGKDAVITLPTNKATFTAEAADPDGTVEAYLWEKVSGPVAGMDGVTTATLSLSALKEGAYTFKVTATDNDGASSSDQVKLTVQAAPKQAPTVQAGADKSITLPTNTATFTAEASDADGGIDAYSWKKISGPTAKMSGNTTPSLKLAELQEGTYVFRITVTDNDGLTASDDVSLQVNPRPNQAPTVNAGADKSITLPTNTTSFTVEATDPDGSISSYTWMKVSGPAATLKDANTHTLSLSGLVEGSYIFRITVTDNNGKSVSDEVALLVKPQANKAPTVNAGENQSITLPTNTAAFTATASDPDGSVAGFVWEKVSGPAAELSGVNSSVLSLSGLVEGAYTFRVTVTDNKGATATDEVQLAVYESSAGNQSPVAMAGADTTVVLPVDYVALKGSGSDSDGTIVSYHWEKISGPEVLMGYADSSYMELAQLQEGVYVFSLTVTDNDGSTASDEIVLTVSDTLVNDLEPEDLLLSSLLAYPNPFNHTLHLKLESQQAELLNVTLTDAFSKVIYKGSLRTVPGEAVVFTIDLKSTNLPGGVYIIHLINQEGTFREILKVIKR